jgi:hypothetical protein
MERRAARPVSTIERAPAPGSPRLALADYLRALGRTLEPTVKAYADWMEAVRGIFAAAPSQRQVSATRARSLGTRYGAFFREVLTRIEAIEPSPAAVTCHESALSWLIALVRACDALAGAPADGRDLLYLRDCRDMLTDAHAAAVRLSALRRRLHERLAPPAAVHRN